MERMYAHRKEYVLGPRPVQVRPDWITHQLADGVVLSRCPALPAQRLISKDGVEFFLLGLAVSSNPGETSIPDFFPSKLSDEIEEWSGAWAGRWLLVSGAICIQDGAGLLSMFYRRIGSEVWISGSTPILGEHLPGAPHAPRIPWVVKHETGMDWIPAPFSARENVFKVLPMRAMDPRDGSMRMVRYSGPTPKQQGRANSVQLARTLATIMKNWAANPDLKEHYVGLTAGKDTRTVLAAAIGAGINVTAYTTAFPFTHQCDIDIPPRLAARVGVKHILSKTVPAGKDADQRAATMAEHLDGFMSPAASHFCRHISKLLASPERTTASGSTFEIGRCQFWHRFTNVGVFRQPTDPDEMLSAFYERLNWKPEPLELWREAMQAYIETLAEPLPIEMDWRDRYFLEQRIGAWLGTNVSVQGLSDVVRFYPGNCLRVTDLLLRDTPARRDVGAPQKEVVELLAPRLLDLPFNPLPFRRRVKETLRSLLGRKPRKAHGEAGL